MIIFLHIPKTAGTTLSRIIHQQYRREQIYFTHPTPFRPNASVESFKKLDPTRQAQIHVLAGHMPFGLHASIPQPSTYFTLLRDPIERVISFYHFVRREPAHYFHEHTLAGGMTLGEFVESRIALATDNFQVRMLSGVMGSVGYGECTPEMLETAKRNLQDHFAVVGLAERFDETLIMLRREFHWRNIFYIRHNVTSDRPKQKDIAIETLNAIRDSNLLDLALYQHTQLLFETRLQQADQQFTRELETFRSINRGLQPLLTAYWRGRDYFERAFLRRWLMRKPSAPKDPNNR